MRRLAAAGLAVILAVGLTAVLMAKLGIWAEDTVYVGFSVDRTQAVAGQILTYSLYVHNQASGDLTNVIAAGQLDANTTYVANSAIFYRGSEQFPLPDSWITDQLNMGVMAAGQQNSVVYQVIVSDSAAAGTLIRGIGQIQPEGLPPFTRSAETTIVNDEATSLSAGDIFQAVNNTRQDTGWTDPVEGAGGEVIEMRAWIENAGSVTARNLTFLAHLPGPDETASTIYPRAALDADNADPAIDNLTVNVQPATWMVLNAGHAALFGTTDMYNCPSGCALNESFVHTPLPLGNLAAGEVVQITFKAYLVNSPSPTPTPTSTVTPTPTFTPTPTPGPSATPTPTGTPTPTSTPTPTPTGTVTPTLTSTPGPTSTPTATPTSELIPTRVQVQAAAVPPIQPQAGFGAVWLGVIAIAGIAVRLLLKLNS